MAFRSLIRLLVGAATATALTLTAVPAQAEVPTAGWTPSAGSSLSSGTGDVLQPALKAHLDEVGPGAAVRVMVQAGGSIAAAEAATRAAGLVPETSLDRVGIAVGVGTPAQVGALATTPGVTRVDWADEEVLGLTETSHVATRALPVHDGAVDVDGDGALDGLTGEGFSVAVVDSGTDGTHPMFADENGDSRVKRNMKVVCSDALPILAGGYPDGFAAASDCTVDATAANDTDTPSVGGHGTHVTGIAAGSVVTDSAGRELRGAAPDSDIVAVSAGATLSVYGGSLGLYWVLENHADPCGDGSCPPIVVVNNSWGPVGGGDFEADAPQVLIQRQLVAEGVSVVWAAGNDGGDGTDNVVNPYSQDPTPGVLSVANYDDGDQGSRDNALNSSSSRGRAGDPATYPDLSAPGTNITAACRAYLPVCATGFDTADPDYNTISGTSMAAPHIAGYIAVLQQAAVAQSGQRLSPGAIEDLLVDTAYQFGSRTYEPDPRNPNSSTGTSFDAGHGLVDVLAAVERLTGQTAPTAPPGASCPVDGRFTDPEGDATGALGTETGGPNATGLDVTEGWLTTDPATSDVTFHWNVSDLADTPGGLEGTGEYFDVNFSLGGGGYYLGATRTQEDGETFVLGKFETTRTTLATGLPGSFDAAGDQISVTLPAALWAELGLPGSVSAGEQIAGVSIVARRSLVLLVPDADTATSGCAYTIGAEHQEPANTAPEISSVTTTSDKGRPKAGDPQRFTAAASDADGDTLTYRWDFGDGSSGSGAMTEHTYAAAGTYTAVATVSDGTDSVTESVVLTIKGKR
ncbi:MAG TPA: S8 family serine peptidase [Nocardioides sp.]|nr:S8 family serine peptidase [Nocardioides sp.]